MCTIRTYSLTGAYRKAFIKPIDLKWYFMNYDSDTNTLIRSDIEELRGEPEPESLENGSQKALILEFNLPSSSYATMALREILKCDTSVAHQVQLQQTTAANVQINVETSHETESNIQSKVAKLDCDTV